MTYDWNDTPVITKYYIFYTQESETKREKLHLTIIL